MICASSTDSSLGLTEELVLIDFSFYPARLIRRRGSLLLGAPKSNQKAPVLEMLADSLVHCRES